MSFIDGFVIPVREDGLDDYVAAAEATWALMREAGALAVTEAWEADVPEGVVTSFPMAVKREEGEKIVFSWVEWPDKETRDRWMAAAPSDPRMEALPMPFDGKRMIYGGFRPIFSARA